MKSFADQAREWLAARGKSGAAIKDIAVEPEPPPIPARREVSVSVALGDRWRHGFTCITVELDKGHDLNLAPGTICDLWLRDGEVAKGFLGYVCLSRDEAGTRFRYVLEPSGEE